MRRFILVCFGLALSFSVPAVVPAHAQAVTIDLHIGSSINSNRSITCSEGERILRNRGFRNIRRVDCRGRFFVYRATRGVSRFEIAIRGRDGRVVDMRRIRL